MTSQSRNSSKSSSKKESNSKQPVKKNTTRQLPTGYIILVIESIALILLIGGIFFQSIKLAHSQNSEMVKINIATAKTTTPQPTPLTSPSIKVLASASPSAKMAPQVLLTVSNVPRGKSVNVPILMYHYISNNPNPADKARYELETTPDLFDSQMNYLAQNGFNPISFDTMYAGLKGQITLPPKPIIISIDDGYVDAFVNAFPILKKYNFHATIFIPTSLMNQGYYLTWDEITQMQKSGLISFEAHSLTHPDLPTLRPDKMKQEIFDSKQVLESHIGVPVNFFAYPYGTSNQLAREYVKEAGFFGAVGTWYGTTEYEGNAYDWPRVRIGGTMTIEDFAHKI